MNNTEEEKRPHKITIVLSVITIIISFFMLVVAIIDLLYKIGVIDAHLPDKGVITNSTTPFFSDVKAEDWCYDAVTYLYNHDFISGIDENHFAPEELATRAMVITILYRLESEPAFKDVEDFNDTPRGRYYSNAVDWAASNRIVVGNNGGFYPNEPITCEQLASILYRYHVEYKGRQATNADSVIWATQSGFFLDIIDNDVNMSECTVTRAQAAVIFMRYCESVEEIS